MEVKIKKFIKSLCLFYLIFLNSNAFAFFELGLNVGLNKQIYGLNKDKTYETLTYSGTLAWYAFRRLALEVNYSDEQNVMTDNENRDLGSNVIIQQVTTKTYSSVYGIGLRIAFAGRRSFLVPSLSLGYAQRQEYGSTTYSITNTGVPQELKYNIEKTKSDSTFGAFNLKINLTNLFSLNGSVKTIVDGIKIEEAKYNLRYLVGLSWYF